MRKPGNWFWKAALRRLALIGLVVLIAGIAGAALVLFSPGYGIDPRALDPRLDDATRATFEQSKFDGLGAFLSSYLSGLLQGDLGESTAFGSPIRELIEDRLPATGLLLLKGICWSWTAGLGAALLVTLSKSRALAALATFVSGAFLSLPSALVALVFLLAGGSGDLALACVLFPKIFRYAANLLDDAARSPHVLAARARGLRESRILARHVLPIAAGPLVALAGVTVSMAFGSAIPIEVICDEPGVGRLAWEAALSRDLPLLVNLTMIIAVLTVLANATADIATAALGDGG